MAYPVLVAISSKEDVIANVVIVHMLKRTVAVGDVSLNSQRLLLML